MDDFRQSIVAGGPELAGDECLIGPFAGRGGFDGRFDSIHTAASFLDRLVVNWAGFRRPNAGAWVADRD